MNDLLNAFVHLYLGHLFGDYVLQNGWIAVGKLKNKLVLLLHVLLVTTSHIVFVYGKGFGWNQLLAVIGIGVLHYTVDIAKIRLSSKGWIGYSVDQAVHVLIILMFIPVFKNVSFWLPEWISYRFAFSIFNAYLIGILFHTVFNSGGYRRDVLGYVFRGVLPWIGNVWIMILVFLVGVFGCGKVYRWRKDVIFSLMVSAVLTTIWEVFS